MCHISYFKHYRHLFALNKTNWLNELHSREPSHNMSEMANKKTLFCFSKAGATGVNPCLKINRSNITTQLYRNIMLRVQTQSPGPLQSKLHCLSLD